jgi:hypothetical protein
MMPTRKLLALAGAVLLALLSAPTHAQYGDPAGPSSPGFPTPARFQGRDDDDRLDIPFHPTGLYRPEVPAPPTVLGHLLGARFTPHHRVLDYMQVLARTGNDRARWEEYGTTWEGRPLGTLTVTSPGNLARLDAIRADLARLADPRETSREEARDLAARTPIVVWLSYNIHGDEASSTEAALATAYELVAGVGPSIGALLDSIVVVIDPCLNPDGRERYVNWYVQTLGREPDPLPASREHDQPWPGGRYNHYLFDLNRDWAWLTQPETRARAAAIRRWRPQVHVDFHEMSANSSYFFFPASEPVNTNLPPQVRWWGEVFGRGNAEAFDARGWRYFTGESFDLHYPGYGDSWPTLQGATGMTYEMAGHGGAGLAVQRQDGTVLTLRERIRRHFVAGMATLDTARRERVRRLVDFHAFFEAGLRGPTALPAAYVFPPGDDPARTRELVDLLLAHGIEIEEAQGTLSIGNPRGYDGLRYEGDFPAGTFVVPTRQPLGALVHALLEPEASLPETLFYDVTAWSLPLAFGIEACWTDRLPSGERRRIDGTAPDSGGVTGGPARAGWLLPWTANAAPKLLNRLLASGLRARYATRPFELDGRWFDRGTVVFPAESNPDSAGPFIDRMARDVGVTVHAARTGFTGSGIDLGSDRIPVLRPPRVAIVAGEGVSPTSFGALWYLLDRQYEIDCSVLPLESLAGTNLAAFNVLIFPDDYSSSGYWYSSRLDSAAVDRLSRWVRAGGTFVGLKGGAAWATADRSGLTRLELKPAEEADDDTTEDDEESKLRELFRTTEERERQNRLDDIPGTILRVTVDPGHPLAFGYSGEVRVLKSSSLVFEPSESGRNVAWYPPLSRVSGYISAENEERLTQTPFLVVEPLGSGRCVLYNDDPNFRVFWYGLNRLFLNSLFFAAGS